jgi:hypothetical protein
MRKSKGSEARVQKKKMMGKQSPKPVPDARLKREECGRSPWIQQNVRPRARMPRQNKRPLARCLDPHRVREPAAPTHGHFRRSRPSHRPRCPRFHFIYIYRVTHDDRYDQDDHDYPCGTVLGYNGHNEVQKPASESSTHPWAQGLHPADALARTHREHKEQHQRKTHSTEPERDSLTPS